MFDADERAHPGAVIIDSHHHFVANSRMTYAVDDYLEDVRSSARPIAASVYVETMTAALEDGPEHLRFLGEVAAAQDAGERTTVPGGCAVSAAILGRVDLTSARRAADALDAALVLAPLRFKGVREVVAGIPAGSLVADSVPPRHELLAESRFRAGFAELARRNLVFDVGATSDQLFAVRDLADAFPEVTIVVNHAAPFTARSAREEHELFAAWRAALTDVAMRENVRCKVGGFGMRAWRFTAQSNPHRQSPEALADTWRPYVETAINAFGVERAMFESNFPTDRATVSFATLWDALMLTVSGASSAEVSRLAGGTASETYGIEYR